MSFCVDLTGLHRLAGQLTALGEELSGAGRALDVSSEVPGLSGLNNAVADFCDAWRSSLQRTGEAASVAGDQLRTTAEVYWRTETVIAQACA